jgi:hypothetical protein
MCHICPFYFSDHVHLIYQIFLLAKCAVSFANSEFLARHLALKKEYCSDHTNENSTIVIELENRFI